MKILSIDTSAKPCSVCIYIDGKFDQILVNENLTHSETLAPLIDKIINRNRVRLSEIDYIAINTGPGSFTGIRIGVSTVKGIATFHNTKCISISTLESLSYNLIDINSFICPLMDARNNRYYFAIFENKDGKVNRLTNDDVKTDDDIFEILNQYKNVVLLGDGAEKFLSSKCSENLSLANNEHILQNAISVCKCAITKINENNILNAEGINPLYLRPSQAERERQERNKS